MVQIVYICECERTEIQREKNEKSTVRPMKRTRKKVCAFWADRAEFID